jgi:hypothetical protein
MASEQQEVEDRIFPVETAVIDNHQEVLVDLEAAALTESNLPPAPLCFPEEPKDEDRNKSYGLNTSFVRSANNDALADEDPSDDAEAAFIEPESNILVDEKEQSCATISSSNDEYLSDIDEEEHEEGEDVDDDNDDDDYDGDTTDQTLKETASSFCHVIKNNWKRCMFVAILVASILVVISMALVCGLTTKCKHLQLNPCERECGGTFPFGCNPDLPNTTKYFCHVNGGCFYANSAQKSPPYDGFCAIKTVY